MPGSHTYSMYHVSMANNSQCLLKNNQTVEGSPLEAFTDIHSPINVMPHYPPMG